jgi:hypothetical protein
LQKVITKSISKKDIDKAKSIIKNNNINSTSFDLSIPVLKNTLIEILKKEE